VGYVPAASATVAGDTSVTGDKVVLGGSSVVTALDRTTVVTLARGGTVDVCQSSSLHLTAGGDALLLALDRGALELHFKGAAADVLMTPDLRFTLAQAGALDLRVRVTRNGDTCVENKGRKAPALTIADQFGEASYEVKANQHVLFEHGNLKEVDDREPVPCGCPPATPPALSIADSLLSGKPATPKQAEAQHPFPAAVSEGLAEPAPLPPQTPGETHVQVAANLNYDGAAPPAPAAAQPAAALPVTRQPPPEPKGFFHSIGHFFKRIFSGQ
jgi:hypothetical protein